LLKFIRRGEEQNRITEHYRNLSLAGNIPEFLVSYLKKQKQNNNNNNKSLKSLENMKRYEKE